jgi:hypothetical protein
MNENISKAELWGAVIGAMLFQLFEIGLVVYLISIIWPIGFWKSLDIVALAWFGTDILMRAIVGALKR